jgi:C_GCAxxG_C_C family probable redox protein
VATPAVSGTETDAAPQIDAERITKSALNRFLSEKRTCCESILMAGCETLAVKSDLVPDIALGLAGGVGLQGDTCGVLTGSALVLSLAIAKKETDYPKKMRTLQAVGRVHSEFKKQFGCTDCRSLCGLDLTTAEGNRRLAEGVKVQKCAKFVEAGASLLARELQLACRTPPGPKRAAG